MPLILNGITGAGLAVNLSNTAALKLPSLNVTMATGALTFSATSGYLDFGSATLANGANATLLSTPANLVLPSGGTLGAVSGINARVALVAINNAGVVELAVVNIAGGNDLSEAGVISTTAISATSTANNVFYSTTARTGVPYRIVGIVDAVNTAGAWAAPILVRGAVGDSLVGLKAALNAAGTAPIFACRAWVNFDGTGTVAIRASGNVSSITDNGVGNYTVNFTTAMPDTGFATSVSIGTGLVPGANTDNDANPFLAEQTTGSVKVVLQSYLDASYDRAFVSVIIFR